ncbi:tetratricopeptide repeat protein [Sphingomonas koreensis]|uniref:tetratricopeptide repeat protein n=1 Tax=Sphingomonas koreensis TaxID=93064 RepID=UPI000ABB8A75|nr:tetratricopeptide repeat protein [Sphingomonas koreensis]PJI86944.1 tetratricopeptide repeat protein [Sphingomonas koreensis]
MMGWIALAVIGAAAFALLWLLRLSRTLWSFAGAALMLGAAGYALQARPDLPGAPVAAAKKAQPDEPELHEIRGKMFGRFTSIDGYFFAADALVRGGDPDKAARMMLGGVRSSPLDASLWTWLGMTLVESDGGTMSPAAGLAFRRAVALAPEHPGPAFFYGLAQARTGKLDAALPWLERSLKLTPEKADYRPEVERTVRSVKLFAVMRARQASPPAR